MQTDKDTSIIEGIEKWVDNGMDPQVPLNLTLEHIDKWGTLEAIATNILFIFLLWWFIKITMGNSSDIRTIFSRLAKVEEKIFEGKDCGKRTV